MVINTFGFLFIWRIKMEGALKSGGAEGFASILAEGFASILGLEHLRKKCVGQLLLFSSLSFCLFLAFVSAFSASSFIKVTTQPLSAAISTLGRLELQTGISWVKDSCQHL